MLGVDVEEAILDYIVTGHIESDDEDESGLKKKKPTFRRRDVARDGSDDDVDVNDDANAHLTHYAFRVSRQTVLKLQCALRNIVSHYFNDHTG